MESFLVNTVHDSAIAEISPEETELFAKLSVQTFTRDTYAYLWQVYGIDFNTTLGVGLKIGPRWAVGDQAVMSALYNKLKDAGNFTLDKTELKCDVKRNQK